MEISNSFSVGEINQQLKLIVDSPPFRNSPTLIKFLSFVVLETIQNKEQYIKEYSIAISVLNRTPDFDPHGDAVVRINAGRLRRALNEYYLIYGINDPIVINVPKGCYVPLFTEGFTGKTVSVNRSVLAEPVNKYKIAVVPLGILSQCPEIEKFALLLGEQLSAQISNVYHISAIGYYSTEMIQKIEYNILEAGKELGVDYMIKGCLQYYDGKLRLLVNLLNVATGEVKMIKNLEQEIVMSAIFEIHDRIVKSVVESVGDLLNLHRFQTVAQV